MKLFSLKSERRNAWLRQVIDERAGLAAPLPVFIALGLATLMAGGVVRAASNVRLIAESREQVIFEIETPRPELIMQELDGRAYVSIRLPGFHPRETAGEPDLPFGEYQIALPAGMEAVAQIVEQEVISLGQLRPLPVPRQDLLLPPGLPSFSDEREAALPAFQLDYWEDPAFYESADPFPRDLVTVHPAHSWRHYQIAPIAVSPLRYDGETGELIWLPRIRVRVLFVESPEATARMEQGRVPYPYDEPRWDPIFRREILNHASARVYRTWRPQTLRSLRHGLREGRLEFRVVVDTVGLYRVTFEELVAAGLTEPDLDWNDLQLLVRGYDDLQEEDPFQEWQVPFLADDSDGDGRFEAGETLAFYGEDAWDFFDLEPGDRRYGRKNTYWIVSGAGAGPVMEERDSWHDWTGLFPLLTYRRTMHFEENLFYMSIIAADDTRSPDAGPQGVHTDHYNWTYPGIVEGIHRLPIKVVGFELPVLFRPLEVCMHMQGQGFVGGSSTGFHRPRVWLSRLADRPRRPGPFPATLTKSGRRMTN